MYTSNPYAQAGWYNPRNPLSVGRSSWESVHPHSPTYGALPTAVSIQSPNIITLRFNSQDTLNCSVVGPNNERIIHIATSGGGQRLTSFTASNGNTFATVEWALHPLVSIAGLVPRQEAMKWMLFSGDRRSVAMTLGSDLYLWLFHGPNIHLHRSGGGVTGERLAKMYWQNGLCLDVNVASIQNGLLEVFLVAAALLQSRQDSRT